MAGRPNTEPTQKQLDAQALREQGLSYRQIARQLGISGNSARMRVVNLRRTLDRQSDR